jgi:hypothetical protein
MRIWQFFRTILVKLGILKKKDPPEDLYPLW